MLKPCNFRSQCLILNHPITKMNCPLHNSIWVPSPSSFLSMIRKQQTITCARKRKRRGVMLELASMLASNLKILPEPLNLLVEEFAQRDGRVFLKYLNGLGGRVFNGWRRKRQTKTKLWWFVLILICGLGLVSWRISELNLFLRVSCFCLVGVSTIQWCGKKAIKQWILGLFLGIILLSSRMGKEDVKFWVERLRIPSPVAQILIGNRNRSRSRTKGGKAL